MMEAEKRKKDNNVNHDQSHQILANENHITDISDQFTATTASNIITESRPIFTEHHPIRTFNLIGIPYQSTKRFKKTIEIIDQFKNIVLDIEAVKINTPVTFKKYQNSDKRPLTVSILLPKQMRIVWGHRVWGDRICGGGISFGPTNSRGWRMASEKKVAWSPNIKCDEEVGGEKWASSSSTKIL